MDRGQSLIIHPLFDGTNYAYWKVCMRAFLQSLDKKVWQAVEIGWTKPKEVPTNWDNSKIKAANFNSRALNVLFRDRKSTRLNSSHQCLSRMPSSA